MDATLITGNTYPNRRALRAAGGRWSADLGGYLFGEDHLAAAAELADQLGLIARQVEVQPEELAPPSYAERRAARTARHQRNADRYDARAGSRERQEAGIRSELNRNPLYADPFIATEPIKVGHHSERRHRRDKARIEAKLDKAHTLWREAADLRGKAAAAAAAATPDAERPVDFMVRRIEELQAQLRKAERRLAGKDHDQLIRARIDGREPAPLDPNSDWGRLCLTQRDEAAEGIAYWQALMDARGGVAFSRDNVKPGDIILVGRHYPKARVVRANPKTVSVVFIDAPLVGFNGKFAYAEIMEVLR